MPAGIGMPSPARCQYRRDICREKEPPQEEIAPNHIVAKSTAGVMDAFASSTHIGMIFARSLYGGDQIVEAKCEACGTNIFYRTYRSDPSYGGVARWGWTG